MGETKSFEDLDVWKKSHALVLEVYKEIRFYNISRASLEELKSFVYLSGDLNY